MKYKLILFVIGLLTAVMGILPLVSDIPAVAQFAGQFPKPGTLVYQAIVTLIGVIAIIYSVQREEKLQKRR